MTSCPTNLGTGMRASVHIKCPNLCKDGTDKKPKAICKPLGLSVRGLGGEHTPIGADGSKFIFRILATPCLDWSRRCT